MASPGSTRRPPALAVRVAATACAVVLLASAEGCSDAGPYAVMPVSGTVTYDDGSLIPATQIMLTFDPLAPPLDTKTHPRKGIGYVGVEDGVIQPITTYKYGDGVTRGKHRLMVVATDASNKLLVPKEYTSARTTPLEVDTDTMPLAIKIPKP